MPLCIAGMARSGTSMVTRLLNLCGLDLGPVTDLLPPAPDNPEGFWENRGFVKVNEAILKGLGARWDRPPQAPFTDWDTTPILARLRPQAAKVVQGFAAREPWGWKDPRNCLTLPLWRSLLAEVRVLICVRNPMAVAESLRTRDGMTWARAFDLWLTYNRRVYEATDPENRVITHYDSYFGAARAELRRVLGLCGLQVAEGRLDRACGSIKPSLTHHHGTVDDLVQAGAPAEVVRCYLDLCAEAGPYQAACDPKHLLEVQ
jgi:hypothetical protein